MATTGHESEAINVQGLKASLQKFKTDKVDGKADKVTVTAGSYNKVTVNSQGVVTAGDNPTTLAGLGITDAYTKGETYNKTEVNGLVDTPHQNYVTVQATAQTTDATDVLPASGQAADTIYRVSNWDGDAGAFDVTKYSEYAWDDHSNPNKYVFLCVKTAIGEVFDISVYNNNAKYTDLADALGTDGEHVPQSLRKGGMSVKFVHSSDHNYVQYILSKNTFSTDINDWLRLQNMPVSNLEGEAVLTTNLYNKDSEDCVTGKYVYYLDGTLLNNASYKASGWIPVTAGRSYIAKFASQCAFYNSQKEYISGVVNLNERTAIAPENASFVRISVFDYSVNDAYAQLNESQVLLPFEPYSRKKNLGFIAYPDLQAIRDNAVLGTNNLEDNSVTPEKVNGTTVISTNLYNKDSEDCVEGKYVYYLGGTLMNSASYKASGWIPVTPGKYYTAKNVSQHAFYNSQKEYISGNANFNIKRLAPENAAFIRISIFDYSENDADAQLNESDVLLPFEPYYVKKENIDLIASVGGNSITGSFVSAISNILINSEEMGVVNSRLWNGVVKSTVASLGNNDNLTLNSYPKSFKTGECITLYAKVSSFTGGIKIGKGFVSYGSMYYQITDTQAILKMYDASEHTIHASDHGLTIADFVKVVITFNDGKIKLLLQSLQDVFTEEFEAENFNGIVKVESNGASLTNVELSATNSMFKKAIWAFGDSYFGITSPIRELYYLKQWGYLNFLVQGFPGQASPNAYSDLKLALSISKPKYLIWCLGMNDNSGLNDWKSYINNIKELCANYNIELILGTIPKPLSQGYTYKDEMSNWIREESGCRVLDIAKAVGSDQNGHWYGYGTDYDYQNTDNVHPTSYGAKAIASQFLIDVPEIMQLNQ